MTSNASSTRPEAVTDLEEFDDHEYAVLKLWYDEGVRIARYLVTFSFATIGFTITLLQLRGEGAPELTALQIARIRWAWATLAVSGGLAGISVLLAFLWLDAIHRVRAPALVKKLRGTAGTYRRVWLVAKIGWITTIGAVLGMFVGIVLVIAFAWSAL